MKKRLMAILLSMCMLLGLLPVTALATEELTEPGITDEHLYAGRGLYGSDRGHRPSLQWAP